MGETAPGELILVSVFIGEIASGELFVEVGKGGNDDDVSIVGRLNTAAGVPIVGETTPGETTPGETTPGEGVTGELVSIFIGDTTPGELESIFIGETTPGEGVTGELVSIFIGDTTPGELVSDELATELVSGELVVGELVSGGNDDAVLIVGRLTTGVPIVGEVATGELVSIFIGDTTLGELFVGEIGKGGNDAVSTVGVPKVGELIVSVSVFVDETAPGELISGELFVGELVFGKLFVGEIGKGGKDAVSIVGVLVSVSVFIGETAPGELVSGELFVGEIGKGGNDDVPTVGVPKVGELIVSVSECIGETAPGEIVSGELFVGEIGKGGKNIVSIVGVPIVGELTFVEIALDEGIYNTTTSTSTNTGALIVNGGIGVASGISIKDSALFYGTNNNYIGLKAPSAPSGITLTLPSTYPSSSAYALTSDTSGNLSFSSQYTSVGYTFIGSNNVSSFSNVTGLIYSSGSTSSFSILVTVTVIATTNVTQLFRDSSGVTFSITTAGQIQYTSSNYPGFISLTMNWSNYVLDTSSFNVVSDSGTAGSGTATNFIGTYIGAPTLIAIQMKQ
ncbi:hypothetical protein HDU81_004326 [Chytriomyces hyalinus]|nr:hypothetical protein HDU81_004326 [Chytriomyces hyalinus]